MSIYKKILMGLLCVSMTFGIGSGTVYAEEEMLRQPETLTGMDENGNVYELDPSAGVVEEMPTGGTAFFTIPEPEVMVVNFNTKGGRTTEYVERGTGKGGYTCGTYGADAAYLGTENGKVIFMLAGVIGEVDESEVQVVQKSSTSSISHYVVSDGRLYHKITTNLTRDSYGSTLDQGPAPHYLGSGTKYYSYDGHYFYTDYGQMLEDYMKDVRTYSVNPNEPYYNYFQYLPLRSQTNYSGTELNNMINSRVSSSSKMRDLGSLFVDYQNLYGVNALLMSGVAANESAWGNSGIAQSKNNLFGMNAVDSSPGESANFYPNTRICIKDFAETYMSKRYLRPGRWNYFGGFLGNKASGINVKYASDPYWGEKAANVAWSLDRASGSRDNNAYTIGIKDMVSHSHTPLNVRKEPTTSSTVVYKSGTQSSMAFLIMGQSGDFYKIQSDGVLSSGRDQINEDSGRYDFENMYAYASKNYITKVSSGGKISENVEVHLTEWMHLGVKTDLPAPQPAGTQIQISANIDGETSGLQYKFVWEKNGWADWGVIQGFSGTNSATWTPKEDGAYKLYVDVKDETGKQETKILDYTVKGSNAVVTNWKITGISTSPSSPQGVGTSVTITPNISGSSGTALEYKFVWQKNSWADWGVIQDFSSTSYATWTPEESGDYKLYVDVTDGTRKLTEIIDFRVVAGSWNYARVNVSPQRVQSPGSPVEITPQVTGDTARLKYKYVWEKNDWADWGVIKDFSSSTSATWTPQTAGKYKIYVDVKDSNGKIKTEIADLTVEDWKATGIEFTPKSPQAIGTNVSIQPIIQGSADTSGLEYKFVWQKNDWADWGVIKDRSSSSSAVWTPQESGDYRIYVDVFDQSGKTMTVIESFKITDWKISVSPAVTGSVNAPTTISVQGVTHRPEIQCKFVWQKNDWADWGVIQDFSNQQSAVWTPKEKGNYKLYVDMKNVNTGDIETKILSYTVGDWSISVNPSSQGRVGKTTTISVSNLSHASNLQYKFVWQKNDWADWGVIKAFSSGQTAKWTPQSKGNYKLYVDLQDTDTGEITTKIIEYKVK